MCDAAPGIVYMLDRMGVPFNRTRRGAARLPPLRRHALPPHGVRRRDDGPAAPLRARRAGAPLGDRRRRGRQGRARARREDGAASSSSGTSSPSCVDDDGVCRGIVAQDLKTMAIQAFPADAVCLATGGSRHRLRPLDQQRHQHGHGAERGLPAGRLLRERRVHPGPPDGHPRRRQAPPHLGERARRGRARLGPARPEGAARRAATSPRAPATTSSRTSTPATATSSRATSRAASSSRSASTRSAASSTRRAAGTRTRSTST